MNPIRLLIVDADEQFAKQTQIMAKKLGYSIVGVTSDSKQAFNLVQEIRPDVILMDTSIQGNLNGIELAEKIRPFRIPILFLTSVKDREVYERARKTCFIGYLVKPVNELTLQSSLEIGLQINLNLVESQRPLLSRKNQLLVKKGNKLFQITSRHIRVLTSEGNYCHLWLDDQHFILNTSLTRILKELPHSDFLQIHKRHVVHLDSIEYIHLQKDVVNICRQHLPIGRTYKKELLNRFQILR